MGNLQGVYIYRHQRLIDCQERYERRNKSGNLCGWSLKYITLHNAADLPNLDFTIDREKRSQNRTGNRILSEVLEYNLKWHPLDYTSANTNRMKQRTNRNITPLSINALMFHVNGSTKTQRTNQVVHVSQQVLVQAVLVAQAKPLPSGTGGTGGTGVTGAQVSAAQAVLAAQAYWRQGGTGGTGSVPPLVYVVSTTSTGDL